MLVARAKVFATEAHRRIHQVRHREGLPFELHLKAVAHRISQVAKAPELLAAAWLHDCIEETPATLDELEREFGPDVAKLVAEVAPPACFGSSLEDQLEGYCVRLAQASPWAKALKLADLVETIREVSKQDLPFANTYVQEAEKLLASLAEGPEDLLRQAQRALDTAKGRLAQWQERPRSRAESLIRNRHAFQSFTRTFRAADLAEPLRQFDEGSEASHIKEVLEAAELEVAGVSREGRICGYVRIERLEKCPCGHFSVAFRPEQILDSEATLTEVIEVLARHDYAFCSHLGEVSGVIRRADIQKPPARMWLFGMLTVTEMDLTERIREHLPDGSWKAQLTPSRLERAMALRAQRQAMGQGCALLDCLQLSDKAEILMRDPEQLAAYGFSTRSSARQVLKDVESLRNNLAHAQDIVTYDWLQIVRFARMVEGR